MKLENFDICKAEIQTLLQETFRVENAIRKIKTRLIGADVGFFSHIFHVKVLWQESNANLSNELIVKITSSGNFEALLQSAGQGNSHMQEKVQHMQLVQKVIIVVKHLHCLLSFSSLLFLQQTRARVYRFRLPNAR